MLLTSCSWRQNNDHDCIITMKSVRFANLLDKILMLCYKKENFSVLDSNTFRH